MVIRPARLEVRHYDKYGCQSEIPSSQADSSVPQSVFPGPNPLIPQRPKNPNVFPEGHRQGRWRAATIALLLPGGVFKVFRIDWVRRVVGGGG